MNIIDKMQEVSASKKTQSVLSVMKKLTHMIKEEISNTAPFKVTYIGKVKPKIVKAKIVKMKSFSGESTDDE